MSESAIRIVAKVAAGVIGLGVITYANPLLAQSGTRIGADNNAWVSIAKPHVYADVLLDTDRFTGVYTLVPKPADVGRSAKIFLVARVNQRWFANDGQKWQPWTSGRTSDLVSFASRTLQSQEKLPFIKDENLQAGAYEIYAGYQVGTQALVANQQPLQFTVNSHTSDTLLPFVSDEGMKQYLKQGMQEGVNSDKGRVIFLAAGATSSTVSAGSRTSSTNLQEQGVDEADSIKVDGNNLYTLAGCDEGPCLNVHTLDSTNAKASPLASYRLGSSQAPDGMYLVENGVLGQKMMVTVAGQNYRFGWMSIWGGWGESKTELEFLNLSAPQAISSIDKFSIDGALVESRKVGDFLYVVTRYTPGLAGFHPWPTLQSEVDDNAGAVATAELKDLLPRIEDSRKQIAELVQSKNCFLPASAVDGNDNPTIITITTVPLKAPASHRSTCFLGNSETLFMSDAALYLATTNWHYDTRSLDKDAVVYSPNHTTSIHKFALNNGSIEYRGSGEVKGHLGWDEDKKSFRMGEHNGYLNIATSIGESWAGNTSTRLTVLKEDVGKHALQTVNVIDGIGLKGEQLYAARFLGDRGYLVTYRVTDPLYVLDLSNQEKPRIAGELKIDGYSDYLHPVSDKLLLGIGKAAVADTTNADGGDGRGAWYQGVKLSLFDVSNLASPKEINSIVLGKRGTQTDVSWDHHALSFLPAVGNEPARLAIPVQLHETVPTWDGFKATDPSAWYDYTHTALYSFEISAAGVSKAGRLISEVAATDSLPVRPLLRVIGSADDSSGSTTIGVAATKPAAGSLIPVDSLFAPIYVYYGDRSVLKDDAVFYIHDGKVLSSHWGESK